MDEKFFKGKKVLITGHTGFKGSWLSFTLLRLGAELSGYSLRPDTEPALFSILGLHNKIKNYFCDIRNYDALKNCIETEKPEIVFHLAAQPLVRESYDNPLYTFQTNIIGTVNLLEAIRKNKSIRSAVVVTTDKVYENTEKDVKYKESDQLGGHDPYSTSKACSELVVNSYRKSFFPLSQYKKSHATLIATARSGNVIGGGDWSRDRLLPDVIRSFFVDRKKLILRNPGSIRPWQHVLEANSGYLLLSQRLYEGQKEFSSAWNFAPEESDFLSVVDIVKKSFEILGVENDYLVEMNSEKPEANILKLDITKAKALLNWRPVLGLGQGLKWTLDWYWHYYNKKDVVKLTESQLNQFLSLK